MSPKCIGVPQGDKAGRRGTWWHDATGLWYTCVKCGTIISLTSYFAIVLETGYVTPSVPCDCGTERQIILENWQEWQWRR